MKKIDLMSVRELRKTLREAIGLLALARCPDDECIRGRLTGRLLESDSRCPWCAEKSDLAEDR